MATYRAIAATSRAILGLLEDSCPRDEFRQAEFKLFHAKDFESPIREGISLYLYRVAVNGTVRNLPQRLAPDGRRYRGPLPVDLFYLITPWAEDVENQQHLLGWCMRTLEDTPILPAGLLNQRMPQRGTFGPSEAVELICDPLSLQDMINVWDKLKPKLQTSMTYVARMVAIESTLHLTEAEPVRTRDFHVGTAFP